MSLIPRSLLLVLLLPSVLLAQQKTAVKKPKKAKEAPTKWRVDEAHGPEGKLSFDTDEGTWISVDVSPDGQQLAFDVLDGHSGIEHTLGSLEQIENTDSLVYVVVNGRVFNATSMDQLWPSKLRCPRFFWQRP